MIHINDLRNLKQLQDANNKHMTFNEFKQVQNNPLIFVLEKLGKINDAIIFGIETFDNEYFKIIVSKIN